MASEWRGRAASEVELGHSDMKGVKVSQRKLCQQEFC